MLQRSRVRLRHRWIALGVALVVVHGAAAAWLATRARPPVSVLVDFQQYRFGVPPTEFDYDATGPTGPMLTAGRPYWRTYVDRFAPSPQFVLIQAASAGRDDDYPIALLRSVETADLTAAVHFKPMGGDRRKSAGILWRARDRNNYYAALASAAPGGGGAPPLEPGGGGAPPLENARVHLVNVVGGRVHEIASAPIVIDVEFERRQPTPTWGWYTLRVRAVGDRITVWFQDARVLDARDSTFIGPGRVGLVTHGDTVAVFDDLHVQPGAGAYVPPARERPARPAAPAVMRVADIFAFDPAGRTTPTTFARGGTVHWKVAIADAHGEPVTAATVTVTLERPDGDAVVLGPRMTGSDGTAWFARALDRDAPAGTYRLRVARVAHADFADAIHDVASDVKTMTSFSVR